MVRIERFDTLDTIKSLGLMIDLPAIGYCAIEDGKVIASFGLAWGEGRVWLWFKVDELQTRHRMTVWRQAERMKRMARQLGHMHVYVIRDPDWETSAKLVKLMGFEFFENVGGYEVHRCELYEGDHG